MAEEAFRIGLLAETGKPLPSATGVLVQRFTSRELAQHIRCLISAETLIESDLRQLHVWTGPLGEHPVPPRGGVVAHLEVHLAEHAEHSLIGWATAYGAGQTVTRLPQAPCLDVFPSAAHHCSFVQLHKLSIGTLAALISSGGVGAHYLCVWLLL